MPKQPKRRLSKGDQTRLRVLELRAQGLTTSQIAKQIDRDPRHVRRLLARARADYESRRETGASQAPWEMAS